MTMCRTSVKKTRWYILSAFEFLENIIRVCVMVVSFSRISLVKGAYYTIILPPKNIYTNLFGLFIVYVMTNLTAN